MKRNVYVTPEVETIKLYSNDGIMTDNVIGGPSVDDGNLTDKEEGWN